jgi:hypothetical protein
VVTSQDSGAVRPDLDADGVQVGWHSIFKHRDKPYAPAKLFEDDLRSVFLPHLIIIRIVKDLREEDAVLLMDNCSHHITQAVIELLSTARVCVVMVTFAPQSHTRQIFQVLDFTLFGVLKGRGQSQLPLGDDAGSARFFEKKDHDHDFQMTMIEPISREHFEASGSKIRSLKGFSAFHSMR